MVRSKAPAKKKQQIDFKKIKRKLGRKLPPPNNATNTEIKSKAIIIPEQSVAAEKNGFATSKKSFTLQELLHKNSHHNANVSKTTKIIFANGSQDPWRHASKQTVPHLLTVLPSYIVTCHNCGHGSDEKFVVKGLFGQYI